MADQEIAIREFWRAFLRTEEAMFGGDGPAPELTELIGRVHPDLEFDIGPLEAGKREIVTVPPSGSARFAGLMPTSESRALPD